jgi:hypothetical protein
MQAKPVTLTGPQADLCRAVLCQELMKAYQQLPRDEYDESGWGHTAYYMELRGMLLILGMTEHWK